MEKSLRVPTPAAQFPGSFAADLREDYRQIPKNKGWKCRIQTYLTGGWNDVSVWKSAASFPPVRS